MIQVVGSLIFTAAALLQSEIEARQKGGAPASDLIKVKFVLESAGKFLVNSSNEALDATVFALNRAIDATPDDEIVIVRPGKELSEAQLEKLEQTIAAEKEKRTEKP